METVTSAQNARVYRQFTFSFAALTILAALSQSAFGQNYLTSTGMPSFGTPEPVALGSVDASEGNLHLSIPLASYSQRGTSQPEPITLEYDSNIWTVEPIGDGAIWEPSNGPAYFNKGGWYFSFLAQALPQAGGQINYQNCTDDMIWMDQNGTTHTFHITTIQDDSNCPAEASAYATDSSGYEMFIWNNQTSNMAVYAPDGTLAYQWPYVQDSHGNYILSEDSNGNYLSSPYPNSSSIVDTLGRTIAAYSGNTVTVTTSQGTAQYQVTYTNIPVNTNFQMLGVEESGNISITVIRSLTLPDAAQSTYYFTYDCYQSSNPACGSPSGRSAYYGEMTGIILPTGGTETYSYQTFSDAYGNKSQWVSNHTSAGGSWIYTPQVLSTCSSGQVNCQQQTTVQAPDGVTIYTYQLNNGAWPTSIVRKDTVGNVMSTATNIWDFSQSCVTNSCHGASFIRLLEQQTTVPGPNGNLKKQKQYTYDSPQYGNQTAIKEWGLYPSAIGFPYIPDRTTYMSYLYYTGVNNITHTGSNNINRPQSMTLCNNSGSSSSCPGGGSVVSQTLYTYDSYGAGLTPATGMTNHDDSNFSASYTTRGNPTQISSWVSGSNYLNTSYTYDTTGQKRSETDPAQNVTTFSYTDNFFTDGGNGTSPETYMPPQPTNAFVTSITDAIGTKTAGYYFGSGSEAVSIDYNGASTYDHYQDNLNRPTEEIDPIGWKLATYSSAETTDSYFSVGDHFPSTSCSGCQHTQTVVDSWGRTASQILVNDPIGPVEIDTNYNALGEINSVSHPYSGASDPNHVLEFYEFDPLERPLYIIHPDGEETRTFYGAGVTALGGPATQGGSPSSYGYGYPQITMDEAGKERQEWKDGFGNIIEVDEPSATTSTQGTGSITLYEGQSQEECFPTGCTTLYDSGTVSVTVFGENFSASYDQYDSGASSIAGQLNASGLVTANSYGDSISVTAIAPGANAQITGSCQSYYPQYFNCLSPSVSGISGGTGGLSSSPFVTNYTYDAGGRLTSVVQGSQTRVFAYDGLGRKVSETTPEAGTVTYSYTTSGGTLCSGDASNICYQTDARGVVSAYTYDHAGRLTGTAYTIPGGKNIASMPNVCTTIPNGTSANVCNYYDQGGASAYGIGRLTEMIDPTGSESYSHDANGRVTQISKIISGKTYNIGYQYDLGGDVTQITYPSGRVVQQAYNAVGQLCQIASSTTGCTGSTYYASGFSYNAPGKLLGFTYGNGVAAAFTYAPARTQLSSLAYAKGSSTYLKLNYWYQQNSPNCPHGTAGNNGSVQCITDLVNSGRNASYSYDPLDR